ncbi:MAG: glycosyl transferase family 2 [Cyanobium sp. CACIAM 14]|nr:MAG: glycosyl transferase family 2 [Cyanobium sp. CACIAM 14]
MTTSFVSEVLVVLSLGTWIHLLIFRGQFWRVDPPPPVPPGAVPHPPLPPVCVVVPARNEAEVLPRSLRSLLAQTYVGSLRVILVDDQSDDGTASVARRTAQELGRSDQLVICDGSPLPRGWSGKLWAMAQGVRMAEALQPVPTYILFTDADIEHEPASLAALVARAQAGQHSLVSLMVRLRCTSLWEKWLIPAFVFFFQMLYPFRWVNRPTSPTAAAAGGCLLIHRDALERIGGLASIHGALIDDCTLAQAVKSNDRLVFGEGRLWLGLSDGTISLRPYPDLASIWTMVARTAFSQLDHSPWWLLGTVLGMGLIYLMPPAGVAAGLLLGDPTLIVLGLAGWSLMAFAYAPMLRFYRLSPLRAFALPAIALLYTLMTIDSALRHWRGRGGAWKGRTYAAG